MVVSKGTGMPHAFFTLITPPVYLANLSRPSPSRFCSVTAHRELHGRSDNTFNIRLVTPEWAWHCIELGRLEPPNDEHLVVLP